MKITDLPTFKAFLERVQEFMSEYAWHTRDCASIDADGEWRFDSPPCSCGYDQALAAMTSSTPTGLPEARRIRGLIAAGTPPEGWPSIKAIGGRGQHRHTRSEVLDH